MVTDSGNGKVNTFYNSLVYEVKSHHHFLNLLRVHTREKRHNTYLTNSYTDVY